PTVLPKAVCPQGGAASETWVVNATDATHVQAAFRFATEHNLKVNVNNTGHAGAGRYTTAFSIATGSMKGLEFHESFLPRRCSADRSHMAATLGAGAQDDETFQALAKHNAVTVGGTYSTVGIVGWATGGGHGWLTSSYGMGADNIFEVEIVTPDGQVLVANECQNTDIFWATRGGGGGTYGVITSITMKAYPMPQTTVWLWNVGGKNDTSSTDWWDFVARFHAKLPALKEQGFQGFYTIVGPAEGPLFMGGYFMAYDKSNDTVQHAIQTILGDANNSTILEPILSNVTRYDAWIDAYNDLPKQVATSSEGGGDTISSTRLLTNEGLTNDVGANGLSSHILAGSFIASSDPADSALNPAWRDAVVHMIVKSTWNEALPKDQVLQILDNNSNGTGRAMRQLSPDSGCYLNECDKFEPNWQWAMYGPNYSRLRAIKAKYDPNDLLWCRRCVGSEQWAYNDGDGSLCRRSVRNTWPNFAYQT
ncbi:hypothetical protein BKA63DRAFT_424441, partial [Paraphoma chrysanthemicola]